MNKFMIKFLGFKINFCYLIIFLFVIFGTLIAFQARAHDLWCFGEAECDTIGCPNRVNCPEIPGYINYCKSTDMQCGRGLACAEYYIEVCQYDPIITYRHENCCDNWGWNNERRCGGCCGDAENCVGYDPSAIYYWHNQNEVWQCSYGDNQNSQYWFVQDCGTDGCDAWAVTGCNGGYIQESRTCHDRGCSGGSCFDNTSTETRDSTNCDASDTCVGTTYRDWYCSGGACTYTDYSDDSRCNNPPNVPTWAAPPHNAWINYNPTFQVRVTDPDNDSVAAYFWINGHPTPYNWGI